jgi:preprotein translocase subunit SecA
MTQALTRYSALYDSITSRRRRSEVPRGLDAIAARAGLAVRNSKVTRAWLRRQAEQTDALAPALRNHSDAALNDLITQTREDFVRGRHSEAAVRQGLALTREIARRLTGEEAYVVQLMGALALYHGRIIEMLTGEGKTLTGSITAPLLAWRFRHIHILTVNDYLAKRDAESRAHIYARCLVTVGAIQQEQQQNERFDIYARHIVYGTPKQITADWLRDQLRLGQHNTPWAGRQSVLLAGDGLGGSGTGPLIPGLRAAMVDEADAVLIDEGVVPLIIARARRQDEMGEIYRHAARIASKLEEGADYSMDYLRRKAEIRSRGRERLAEFFTGIDEPIFKAKRRAEELIRTALVARHCYLRGQQYQIVDGRIVIVDEYTGRFLTDRNWEHGLHQAVEAKEAVEVTADRETLARVSFQRFFRSYPFLCGMTGTAADATVEMEKVYSRRVTVIPTNRPVIREQRPTRIFRTAEAKWRAIVESIAEAHARSRPVLVGTRSIEASEHLAQRLEARGLPHRILNANFDKEEADMIAGAGKGGRHAAITVATNMAGRGTDIKPDGAALEAGGLHVLLTEIHTAKRIDRQFIGRSGRQGDPGSAQIFASLEDELARLYLRHELRWVRTAPVWQEEEAALRWVPVILRTLRMAQRRAEARARRGRSGVLRQDDWIDKHLPGM